MNKPAFPIVFAIDAGYAKYLSTAIYSLLKNNSDFFLRIIILTSGISKQDEHKLQNICLKFKTSLKITLIDDRYLDNLKLGFHFNKCTYFKLFTADFIHDDKCLYLDSDIIVNDSIFEIINIELGETYLAAVEEKNLKRNAELGMNINSKYFNSGVMLINLNKWRSGNIKSKVISFVEKNPTRILYADQCGLNAVIDGDFC